MLRIKSILYLKIHIWWSNMFLKNFQRMLFEYNWVLFQNFSKPRLREAFKIFLCADIQCCLSKALKMFRTFHSSYLENALCNYFIFWYYSSSWKEEKKACPGYKMLTERKSSQNIRRCLRLICSDGDTFSVPQLSSALLLSYPCCSLS